MAKRRRKRAGSRRRAVAARASVNPRRRRRHHAAPRHRARRHYARNPNIFGEVKSFAIDTGLGIAGIGLGSFATSKIVSMAGIVDATLESGIGIGLGLAIRLFGPRLGVSREAARTVGNAAALMPTRSLILANFPSVSGMLGSYSNPSLGDVMSIPGYRRPPALPRRGAPTPGLDSYAMGSYAPGSSQPS